MSLRKILFFSIACKSSDGTRKQQSCFWRCFTSGFALAKIHNKKSLLFWSPELVEGFWRSKKVKEENTAISIQLRLVLK
jgi:hypothetical protein